MTVTNLREVLERAQSWPEEAQSELLAIANQIEHDLQGDYIATSDELQAIDAAIASIDAGEAATEEEVRAAFAKFRSA
jgi:predicted transcriptional regulator